MPLKRTTRQRVREPDAPEPEQQAGPAAARPGPEPGGEQAVEAGRPYRDFVEAEAREYWQEITKPGSLVKPTTLDMYDTMPIRRGARHRAEAENRYAEALVAAMQPWPEAGATRAMEPERPYQAFVESEARTYWQETSRAGALVKPAQAHIRAAALPILCLALRNRAGSRRYVAVGNVVQHAKEKRWMNRFAADANESPSYIEALIQLADDTNRLAREIPLPDHPPPYHPPIYYTIFFVYGRPVPFPRVDAKILGEYLCKANGSRITNEKYLLPFVPLPGHQQRIRGFGTLVRNPLSTEIFAPNFVNARVSAYFGLTFERARKPTNRRGVYLWVDWRERKGNESICYASNLSYNICPSDLIFSPPSKVPLD